MTKKYKKKRKVITLVLALATCLCLSQLSAFADSEEGPETPEPAAVASQAEATDNAQATTENVETNTPSVAPTSPKPEPAQPERAEENLTPAATQEDESSDPSTTVVRVSVQWWGGDTEPGQKAVVYLYEKGVQHPSSTVVLTKEEDDWYHEWGGIDASKEWEVTASECPGWERDIYQEKSSGTWIIRYTKIQENPQDPQDPQDPQNPQDPQDPQNPQDPVDPQPQPNPGVQPPAPAQTTPSQEPKPVAKKVVKVVKTTTLSDVPKTGDNKVTAYALFVLLAATAALFSIIRLKKDKSK